MSNRPETNKQSCPVYKKCGGCQLQNLSYPEQLEFKQKKVEKLLKRFCTVEKIIGMKTPYHYRNKVQAAFYTDKKGKIISGNCFRIAFTKLFFDGKTGVPVTSTSII